MVYIGFSTTDEWISKIIRFFTHSEVSHCFLLFVRSGITRIIHTDIYAVHDRETFKEFKKHNHVLALYKIYTDDADILLKVAAKKLYKKYNLRGMIGHAIKSMAKWVGIKIHNPFNNPNALFCSQMIVQCLQDIHYPGADLLNPIDTTPEDLYSLFKSSTLYHRINHH